MAKKLKISEGVVLSKPFSVEFDNFLFESGNLYTIYGKPKVGKTALCLYLSNKLIGFNKKVLYIDAEKKLKSYSALKVYNTLSNKILNLDDISSSNFVDVINKLDVTIREQGINSLIIDSLSYPFMGSSIHWKKATPIISDIVYKLKLLTQKYNLITIMVTHSFRNWDRDRFSQKEIPKGGRMITYISDKVFEVKREKNSQFCQLIEGDNNFVNFVLNKDGTIGSIG